MMLTAIEKNKNHDPNFKAFAIYLKEYVKITR